MSASGKLVRRPEERHKRPAQTKEAIMRVMVFAKATEGGEMGGALTAEQLKAF
jgi:hypothetical protein